MKKRASAWILLPWLALPLLLWLTLRQIPLDQLWLTLQSTQAWHIGVLAALNVLILLSFNLRWWMVLMAQGYSLPYLNLTIYRLAGFAISYLTPGTQFGGEPLQMALLHRRHNVPIDTSMASVTLDKLLELLANYIFLNLLLLVVLFTAPSQSLLRAHLLVPLFGLLLVPLAHLIALRMGFRPVTRLFYWLEKNWHTSKVASIHRLVIRVEEQIGLFCRDHLKVILFSVNFSLGVWTLVVLEHWLVYAFLGLRLSLSQLVVLVAAMRLAFLTPFPGGLGALEASQVLTLQALGLNPAFGVGVILWIRLRDLVLAGIGTWAGAAFSRTKPPISVAEDVSSSSI